MEIKRHGHAKQNFICKMLCSCEHFGENIGSDGQLDKENMLAHELLLLLDIDDHVAECQKAIANKFGYPLCFVHNSYPVAIKYRSDIYDYTLAPAFGMFL